MDDQRSEGLAMSATPGSKHVAERRRQFLSLSSAVALVLVVIVGMSNYATFKLAEQMDADVARIGQYATLSDDARIAQVAFKTQVQEWKNILLRGYVEADLALYHAAFVKQRLQVENALDRLAETVQAGPASGNAIGILRQQHHELNAAYDRVLSVLVPSDPLSIRATDQSVRGMDRPLMDGFDRLVEDLRAASEQARQSSVRETARLSSDLQKMLWVTMLLGFVLLTGAVLLTLRSILK
ncbi:MAG: hypothetical protein B7Y80_08800 [Hyphomicrobium sp. 32-62-53]|nr:MAG: hypothetical protein B7Y80_08800 [Hyphomicrobium sp. 32-62-53]